MVAIADNTTVNVGSGGDVVRDKDRAGIKTQIVGLDLAVGGATEILSTVPQTGTNTSVAGTVTASTTLLAANTARGGATVYNDSTATLYLSLGATTTTVNYTIQINPNGYYEVPFGYRGIITGTWAVAAGNARITELT